MPELIEEILQATEGCRRAVTCTGVIDLDSERCDIARGLERPRGRVDTSREHHGIHSSGSLAEPFSGATVSRGVGGKQDDGLGAALTFQELPQRLGPVCDLDLHPRWLSLAKTSNHQHCLKRAEQQCGGYH